MSWSPNPPTAPGWWRARLRVGGPRHRVQIYWRRDELVAVADEGPCTPLDYYTDWDGPEPPAGVPIAKGWK